MHAGLSGAERLEVVVDDDREWIADFEGLGEENYNAPLELAPGSIEDPYRLEKWVSLSTTTRAILVGTSMRRAIVCHHELWKQFVNAGKQLRVLVQGDLGTGTGISPMYTYIQEMNDRIAEKRDASLAILKEISRSAEKDTFEVRNSGRSLISYSAIILFRVDGTVDVQIQPYVFLPNRTERGARFILNTPVDGNTYRILVRPIEKLWSYSIPEIKADLS